MWLCLNNSFLSIVQPEDLPAEAGDVLLVRARVKGHIEAVFPKAVVSKSPERDYLFRALIPRQEVAAALADQVRAVDYPNFKDSVRNKPLHDAFAAIWHVMVKLQPSAPWSGRFTGRNARQAGLPLR